MLVIVESGVIVLSVEAEMVVVDGEVIRCDTRLGEESGSPSSVV